MTAAGTDVAAYLLGAHALHLGFQLTVTLLVYPALAAAPADRWSSTHRAHSRRIAPVVGVVYLLLAGTSLLALLQLLGVVDREGPPEPGATATVATVLALVGAAGSALSTALGAARTHGRLAEGRDQRLVDLLLRQDRVRLAFAVLGALGALAVVVVVGR